MSEQKPVSGSNEQALQAEIARLNKIIHALMNRSERNASIQGSDFNLFQTAVTLEDQVRQRTVELEEARLETEKITRTLRERENNYRLLLENSPVSIHEIDMDGRIISMSLAGILMHGFKDEDSIKGSLYLDGVSAADRERIGGLLTRAYAGEISNFEFKASGPLEPIFKSSFVPIKNKNGDVEKLMGITEDITERKCMDDKLRFEEQRFRAFVEHASDMIVLVSPEGVILYVNPAIETILGFKPEERIGANGIEIVHPDDIKALADVFNALSRDTNSPVMNAELRLRHKDGSWRTLDAAGSNLVKNNVVEAIIINYRDITERKKAEDALRKSEEKFKQLAEVFPETIFEANMKGNVTYANEHGLKQFGLTQEDIVSGINIFDLVSPLDRNLAMERIQTRIKDNDESDKRYLEYKAIKKDGSTFYALALSVPIMVDGVPVGIRGFILDITERKQAENMLYESEERYRLIAENTADTISVFDLNLKPTYISPSILKLRGYTVQEAMTQTLDQMLTPDSLQQARKHFADQMALELSGTADPTRTILMELEEYCKDGSTILVELAASFLRDKNFKPTGILTVTRDITERKKAEEQIQYLATHDLLTDLPSLRFAKDRLSMALNMARRYKKAVAVMFIDLDGFKDVNDTLGHDAGDYVLQQVAKRMLSCVRETDIVSRVGGDEFLIIATEINTPENVAQIAEKVIHLVSQPIIFNGRQSVVSASIGIALFPDDGIDMDQLIKKADDAMYSVKKASKNGFRFINPKVN
jgi:diguanylate cyclase (GGDEF)-like protein/PAS domain S-box-containing protein